MIAQVQGKVTTKFGNFLYTSRHTKKSVLPWKRKDFFVGYWAGCDYPAILSEIGGDYIVEAFSKPVIIAIAQPSEDEINQAFEDAEQEQEF